MNAEEIESFVPPPLKSDVVFAERAFRGRKYFVAKNKLSEKYFRFSPEEAKIALWMDGRATVAELRDRGNRAFPQRGLTADEVFGFYRRLSGASLLNDSPEQFVRRRESVSRLKSSWFGRWSKGIGSLIFFRVPLLNPNGWIGAFAPVWRALFTPWALAAFLFLWAYAITGIVLRFSGGGESGLSFLDGFSFPLLWIGLAVSKTLHEIAHAATCKAFGGNVNEMGLSLICLTPCGYVDASDAWMMDSRWKRLAVSVAGVYTELILGGIAAVVWLHTADGVLHSFALGLMLIASVNTLLFNLNPLMRFDGYYLASDLLDIPNLRPKALGWVGGYLKRFFYGSPPPSRQDGDGMIFGIYAFAAFAYIIVISVSIGFVFLRILEPVGLRQVGIALGVFVFVSLFGLPIAKSIREVSVPQARLGAARPLSRATFLVLLIGAVLVLVSLLPTRHVVRGQGVLEGGKVFTARAPVAGVLDRLFVEEGESVGPGELLFRFRDEDSRLALRRIAAALERERLLHREKAASPRAEANRTAAIHAENIRRLEKEKERVEARLADAEVSGGLGGIVARVGARPLRHAEGAFFRRGAEVLRVSEPADPRVLVALPERDARILSDGDRAVGRLVATGDGIDLRVESIGANLAAPGEIRGGHLLPAGGSVPVRGDRPTRETLDQFPVVVVELVPEAGEGGEVGPFVPGQRIRVRLEGASTTLGGRLWRSIRLFWEDRVG